MILKAYKEDERRSNSLWFDGKSYNFSRSALKTRRKSVSAVRTLIRGVSKCTTKTQNKYCLKKSSLKHCCTAQMQGCSPGGGGSVPVSTHKYKFTYINLLP